MPNHIKTLKIAPSILSADFSKLDREIAQLEVAGADYIHIDVMDGHYVPNLTLGPPVIRCLRKTTDLVFDVHLMIEQPDRYLKDYKDAGADIITVHAEACQHLNRTIQTIRQMGCKAGVSLNPATSLDAIEWVADMVDMVLLMSVNPGFGGQSYIESTTTKIARCKQRLHERGLHVDIQVDGGIGLDNIHTVTKAGANVIVAGSSIFQSEDVKQAIEQLRQKAEQP